MKKIFSEPLFQFFMLGVLLYVSVSFIRSRAERASREIEVSRDRVALMISNYKSQLGVLPSEQQLEEMINNYIKEEIAYREAKKMGLDRDDEIIRRRLSQKYEFLQSDLVEIPTPTEEQLKDFYKSNPALFSSDATVNFSHIYFNADNLPETLVKQRALEVLHAVKNSGLQHAPEKGDRFALQYDYTGQSAIDVKSNFGDKPIVDSLFHGAVGVWIGPVQSGYGWHLLFISKRDSSAIVPYENVKADVKTKYLYAEKERQNKEVFERVSKDYFIKKNYPQEK